MFIFSKEPPKTFNPLREKRKYNDMRLAKNYHRNSDDESKFFKHEFCQQEMVVLANVWHMTNRGNDNIAHKHPAIFPEKLAQGHILSWSNKGDVVLDPMMGSGTVGKMAKLNHRKFIGIEISPEYFEIAKRRIDNTMENL
jgi:site-specific DNA-methyltransferase (adenine-specific)